MHPHLETTLPGVLAALLLAGGPAVSAPFSDVEGEIAHLANALGSRNVLPAVWGAVLAPHAPIRRYEQAWILAALLDPKEHPFAVTAWPDVPPGHWALLKVNQVVGVGLLKDDGGRFHGDRTVRRDEFVAALDGVLKLRATPPPPPRAGGTIAYPDTRGNPHAAAIESAANFWQFLEPAPRFRPGDMLTRGEAVEMLAKAAPLVDRTYLTILATPTPTPTPVPTPTPRARPTATPLPSGLVASPSATADIGASPVPSESFPPLPAFDLPPIDWRWEAAPSLYFLQFADYLRTPLFGVPAGAEIRLRGDAGPILFQVGPAARVYLASNQFTQVNVSAVGRGLYHLGEIGAVGAGAVIDFQSLSGSAAPTEAKVANRTFIGAGPAGQVTFAAGPVDFTAGMQVQVGYAIAQAGGPAFGVGYQIEGRVPSVLGDVGGLAALRGQSVVPASGGFDFMNGLLLGVGGGF